MWYQSRTAGLVWRQGGMSLRLPLGPGLAALAGLGLLLLLLGLCLMAGDTWLVPADLLSLWRGEAEPWLRLLVWDIRLPRLLTGLGVGAVLALAGSLLQAVARNPLATPDLLGINHGALLAVLAGLWLGNSPLLGGALLAGLGASVTLLLLLLLCGRGLQGHRLVLMGLGLGIALRAAGEMVITQLPLHQAASVYTWSLGSLLGRDWSAVQQVSLGLAVLLPLARWLGQPLTLLRFEPALARSLGVRLLPLRWLALLLAAASAGLATALAGPIAFVALMAPVILQRLAPGTRLPLVRSALLGGATVMLADTLGRVILPQGELPVGVICTLLGGPFLLWLLWQAPPDKE
ncbi:iron ABC transporter permease [Pseudaeromonas sp. ZJS20]|uniref:FecCD family ABC transporter permease n=1 Tax=Pseudaeromonas aegiceratis TaxID=3153928 RepID=UPI00390CBF15